MFRRWRWFIVGMLALAFVAMPAPNASAGNAGQQVGVNVSCGNYIVGPFLRDVTIWGPNHSGQPAYWHSTHTGSTRSMFTWNWWWVGSVTLQYKLSSGKTGLITVNVPRSMQGDVYTINITSCY